MKNNISAGNPYPELKSRLLEAMANEDIKDVARTLKTIENTVAPSKIPPKDMTLHQKAEEMVNSNKEPICTFLECNSIRY